jgi:aerobic-type carbon monoxide dehydrogenase small subunit (CoxS/CutS family)
MPAIQFVLNGKSQTVDTVPAMPLLWVLRDTLNLTGTKFGCGMALCGACTVHVNGQPMRSCSTPVSSVAGKHVTTIEGLSPAAALIPNLLEPSLDRFSLMNGYSNPPVRKSAFCHITTRPRVDAKVRKARAFPALPLIR